MYRVGKVTSGLTVMLAVLAAAACVSKDRYDKAVAVRDSLTIEKDSLLGEVLETMKFVADVNTELAKGKDLANATADTDELGAPGAQRDRIERAAALERIQLAVSRLNEAESQLAKSQQRIRALSRNETKLLAQVQEYETSLANLRATLEQREAELTGIIEQQKGEILALTGQVDTLSLTAAALSDTVRNLSLYQNTVYYVAGSKDELIEQGVLVEEGSKFLFFGSKRLAPARELNVAAFTPIDMNDQRVILLPDGSDEYRIVTRQNTSYADSVSLRDGRVRGEIRITSPRDFWAPSRFLILVKS